jgi:hypothetical protein
MLFGLAKRVEPQHPEVDVVMSVELDVAVLRQAQEAAALFEL